ncbi:MAG TPA: EAL domain-containing protein [Hyphomicrobiales bacterium]|nr:EAL domain-containing protein [Hyphomicrobiales bacterium]
MVPHALRATTWKQRLRRRPVGLATRFTLFVAALLIVLDFAFFLVHDLEFHRLEHEAFVGRVRDLVAMIDAAARHGTLEDELQRVQSVLDEVSKEPSTRFVYATALDGRLEPIAKLPREVTLAAGTVERDAIDIRHPVIRVVGGLQRVAVPILADGRVVALVGAGVSRAATDAALVRVRRGNLVLAIGFFAVALILTALLMRRVVAPVRRLTDAMERVAAGDLNAVAPVARRDEIGSLSRAFGAMTASLAESAETVQRLTFTDPVTGLPNRAFLRLQAETALKAGRAAGLMVLRVDRLERVHEAFGPDVADQLLIAAAHRLSRLLRDERRAWFAIEPGDVVLSRFGSEGLAILACGLSGEEELVQAAQRVIAAFRAPFTANGHSVALAVGIGLALSPADGEDFAALQRSAQSGLQEARRAGRSAYRFARADLNARSYRLLVIEQELRLAIERHEIEVWYQPQVTLTDGVVHGAEALIRWRHPVRGVLAPGEFLEVAEELGFLDEIGMGVLAEVARQSAAWAADGLEPRLSVNVTAAQCERPDFSGEVLRILDKEHASARRLDIEITETVAMRDAQRTAHDLAPLRAAGIRIAVDDFGTGYSNLVSLTHMPFDVLKIDHTFIARCMLDDRARVLVTTMLAMARQLGVEVIAEGVESEEQRRFLLEHGCLVAQGFLFGRAMPADEFERLYRAQPGVGWRRRYAIGEGNAVA